MTGAPVHAEATFTTLSPTGVVTATITPSDGLAVGVGQPVVVKFDQPITNKEALLKRLGVSVSEPVTGGWYWFSDTEVHFRPENYWTSGEQVTVTADLDGLDNGGGIWGQLRVEPFHDRRFASASSTSKRTR